MKNQPTNLARPNPQPANINTGPNAIRTLVIDAQQGTFTQIGQAVKHNNIEVHHTPDVAHAILRDDFETFDVILVEDTQDGAIEVIATHLQQMQSVVRIVALGDAREFTSAVNAMRYGAVDYILKPIDPKTIASRLVHAASLGCDERRRVHRIEQLRSVCQRMNVARLDVTSQIDTLCNDLVHAYQDLTDQISHVTAVTEFTAIIRQDLDVEDLLRSSLEYFLKRLGPTNAAVFLASGGEDFSLGAYVNYDCSEEAGEFLLNHLVDVITPLMVDETHFRHLTGHDELTEWIGDDAVWLADSDLIAFPCRHDGECLAVFTIWRDEQNPFTDEQLDMLHALAEVFSTQLAHVVHVHHRHLPDDVWPDDDFDDNPDSLAA